MKEQNDPQVTVNEDPSRPLFVGPINMFPTSTLNVHPSRIGKVKGRTIPITVHMVGSYNRRFLPSFADVGFEFSSLGQSQFIRERQFTKDDFYQMMRRVEDRFAKYGEETMVMQENNHEPVLQAIIRDFNSRNGMDYEVHSTQILRLDESGDDTPIHLDGAARSHEMRLWIPLTTTLTICYSEWVMCVT